MALTRVRGGVTIAVPFDEVVGDLGPVEEWSPRKREIWDQLGAVFLVEGFRSLTVGDLAERLACSRRTLYTLADNRDDLVRGVVGHLLEAHATAATEAVATAELGVPAVVAHLAAGLVSFEGRTVFFDDVVGRAATARLFRAYRSASVRALVDIVSAGVAVGALRSCEPEIVADVLDGMAERLAQRRFRDPTGLSSADAVEVIRTSALGWSAHA